MTTTVLSSLAVLGLATSGDELDQRAKRKNLSGGQLVSSADEVTYKVADGELEWRGAFRLAHDAYSDTGLMPETPYDLRVTPYQLRQRSSVFVAHHRSRLIYTTSLVLDGDGLDSDGDLPMEEVFPEEVASQRAPNVTLAEVTSLASVVKYFNQTRAFKTYVDLIALVLAFARHHDVQRLVFAVHPRHGKFYEDYFGCERIGPERAYSSANKNPAVPYCHDFRRLDRVKYRLYDRIYSRQFSDAELSLRPVQDSAGDFAAAAEYCGEFLALAAV